MSEMILDIVVIEERNEVELYLFKVVLNVYNLLNTFLINKLDSLLVNPLETIHNV